MKEEETNKKEPTQGTRFSVKKSGNDYIVTNGREDLYYFKSKKLADMKAKWLEENTPVEKLGEISEKISSEFVGNILDKQFIFWSESYKYSRR